jgi:hypothetical protein
MYPRIREMSAFYSVPMKWNSGILVQNWLNMYILHSETFSLKKKNPQSRRRKLKAT